MRLFGVKLDFSLRGASQANQRSALAPGIRPDDDRWYTPFIQVAGRSGNVVNEETAMTYTSVFACVTLIADVLSSIPLKVYKKKSDKSRKEAEDHPVFQLLRTIPCKTQRLTSMEFRYYLTAHYLLWGNAYAQIIRNEGGDPIDLVVLHPSRVEPVFDDKRRQVSYLYKKTDNTVVKVPGNQILHIKGYSDDGLKGKSLIRMFQEVVDAGLTMEQYTNSFFGNAAMPAGVIQLGPDQDLSTEARERLKKDFQKMYGGAGNAGQVAILEEGMTWKQLSLPQQDSEFLSQRKFQVVEICRIFRVPPHMIGELDRATFSNIEHQDLSFAKYTIGPIAKRWEEVIDRDLLESDKKYYSKHNFNALVRADFLTRMRAYAVGRQWGIYSANDCREFEELDSIGEEGDIYLSPLNMVSADKVDEQGEPEANKNPATPPADGQPEPADSERSTTTFQLVRRSFPDGVREYYRTLFEEHVGRILVRLKNLQTKGERTEDDFAKKVLTTPILAYASTYSMFTGDVGDIEQGARRAFDAIQTEHFTSLDLEDFDIESKKKGVAEYLMSQIESEICSN